VLEEAGRRDAASGASRWPTTSAAFGVAAKSDCPKKGVASVLTYPSSLSPRIRELQRVTDPEVAE